MKNILLSARPKWTAKILNGEKTVEIRKNAPKCDLPVTVYIYCTIDGATKNCHIDSKGRKNLLIDYWWDAIGSPVTPYSKGRRQLGNHSANAFNYGTVLNGKVVAKFTLREVSKISCSSDEYSKYSESACLTVQDFISYCNGQDLYAWHISDLVVFDKPLELGEFKVIDKEAVNKCANRERVYNNPNSTNGAWLLGGYVCKNNEYDDWCDPCRTKPLTRPPQSWQFIEPPTDGEED